VQSIPESATLGEASVQLVAAVADPKARVLQEQEVIDGEATPRPSPPHF